MAHSRLIITGFALLAAAPAALVAQSGDSARVAQDSTLVRLSPLVVSVSRTPVRANRLGFSVTVLTADELRARRARTAADALRNVGGAFIDEAAGPGGPAIVRLRGGEEVFTQILMDGVRVNQNGGFFDFQGVTLGNIERIEIARGPHSALHGSSAMSGVINLLTRAGESGPPRLALFAEAGTHRGDGGGYRTAVEASGGAAALRYSAGIGWTYDRGIYALPHDIGTAEASLRLDAAVRDGFDITGTVRWTDVDAMLPIRDAGATRAPLDPNAHNERDRLVSAVTARLGGASHWRHTVRVSAYREGFVYDDRKDNVAATGDYDFFVFDADFRLDSRLWRTALEYGGTYFADRGGAVLSWGAVREREDLEDRTSGEFGDGLQQLDRSSTATFAELIFAPAGWLDLIAGARAEKYEGLGTSFTPRASAAVDLTGLVRSDRGTRPEERLLVVRLAAGRAFKAPNLQEQFLDNPFILSNPDLEPETSTSWEVGLDLETANGRLSAGATFFRQQFRDLIRSVQVDDTGRQQNRNLGASRAQGLEWRIVVRPSAVWSFGTDGAWVRTRILENTGLPAESFPEDGPLPFRPAVVAGSFLEWKPAAPLRARLRADIVGRQTVLTERFSGRRTDLDAYVLTGIAIDWDVSRTWRAWARVHNAFDRPYQTAFDRHGAPVMGRIGLEWLR